MNVPGPLCPLKDGRHRLKPFASPTGIRSKSGFACAQCSKTWEWIGDHLVATYDLIGETYLAKPHREEIVILPLIISDERTYLDAT